MIAPAPGSARPGSANAMASASRSTPVRPDHQVRGGVGQLSSNELLTESETVPQWLRIRHVYLISDSRPLYSRAPTTGPATRLTCGTPGTEDTLKDHRRTKLLARWDRCHGARSL